ncbi:hypothetical protein DBR24_29455, partial [Pseudomonas sp. HMWF006]
LHPASGQPAGRHPHHPAVTEQALRQRRACCVTLSSATRSYLNPVSLTGLFFAWRKPPSRFFPRVVLISATTRVHFVPIFLCAR